MTAAPPSLQVCVDELVDSLLAAVAGLLEPGAGTLSDGETGNAKSRRRSASPLPTAVAPFNLLTDVHCGARDFEARLRAALGFTVSCPRGGSMENTYQALSALPALVDALAARVRADGSPASAPGEVLRTVRSWRRRALTLLGYADATVSLKGKVCPYCGCESLIVRPGTDVLVCAVSTCRDGAGNRPRWPLHERVERVASVLRHTSVSPPRSGVAG